MDKFQLKHQLAALLFAPALLAGAGSAQAAFVVTHEAAGITQTTASFKPHEDASGKDVVGVEDFNAIEVGDDGIYISDFGNSSLGITGTYTHLTVIGADQYGGASGKGDAYAVAGLNNTKSYSIDFDKPLTYFGFWLSALDHGNQLSFYLGNDQVFSFTANKVIETISHPKSFYGNPVTDFSGQNLSEPYVFLNFFATEGSRFDRIVFDQSAHSSAGYESDNHTVGYWQTQSGTDLSNDIPEPASMLLLGTAALLAAGGMSRRKRIN